jgi:hypothetical protein
MGDARHTIRAIAREAYLYGFPMVEAYRTLYAHALDIGGPDYEAPFNRFASIASVFPPKDLAVAAPNVDTVSSRMWMDLRVEPLILTLPEIDPRRFYHVQLADLYTHNFAYLGTRTTGSHGGRYLVAGPRWKGPTPSGVQRVLRCETELACAIARTQLFGPHDLETAAGVHSRYGVEASSRFLGQRPPPPAPAITWPVPVPQTMAATPDIFRYLNFLLTFAPTHSSENDLMARFAVIGVGAGKPFDEMTLTTDVRNSLERGIADGVKRFTDFKRKKLDTRKITTARLFGTREHLKNDYFYRYAAARWHLFGNSAEEISECAYVVDSAGAALDAGKRRYRMTFKANAQPPAGSFWSVTMYDGLTERLVENRLNRYVIGSPMLPDLRTDADGGVTLLVQRDPPEAEWISNWLPAPAGRFLLVLRLYLPKPQATSGTWKGPPLTPVG